jgi:hypothetical protein
MAEINENAGTSPEALLKVLEGMLTDLTAVKSAVDAMATKLNADTGVTGTDYASASTLVTKS